MADRYIAFTVTLEEEIRGDESEPIVNAIRMIRGVGSVVPVVKDVHDYCAGETARRELTAKILDVLKRKEA